MKYFGIANPRIAWNASIPVFWVLFGLVMSIGWKAEVAWLFPITFLAPEPPVEAEGTLAVAQKWGVTAHGYGAVWADGNVLN